MQVEIPSTVCMLPLLGVRWCTSLRASSLMESPAAVYVDKDEQLVPTREMHRERFLPDTYFFGPLSLPS